MKNIKKLLVTTCEEQVSQLEKKAFSILPRLNQIMELCMVIGENPPSEIIQILDWLELTIQNKFDVSNSLVTVEISRLLGIEKQYSMLLNKVPEMLSNADYRRFREYVEFDKQRDEYKLSEDVHGYIKTVSSTFLTGRKEIELYNLSIEMIDIYKKMTKVTGLEDDMRNRRRFGSSVELVRCDPFNLELMPSIENIKKYAELN